jgi:formylglycine-generating enzyme required for sulfatase activity
MKRSIYFQTFLIGIITWSSFSCKQVNKRNIEPDGFVCIPGGAFVKAKYYYYSLNNQGTLDVSVTKFEMMDHTVTNREYKAFTDATGYPVPLHWLNGKIPNGKEEYPVIFVNREDVEAYSQWLTKTTGRVYRLPTLCEYEWAARGGKEKAFYFWGNDESLLTTENVNYNAAGDRKYNQWEKYLKPARWGLRNGYGLYNISGNVWQLVEEHIDPSTLPYLYRIESKVSVEYTTMGGGWANSKEYLQCAKNFGYQHSGCRYPDLGFRLVREPEGEKWAEIPRQLCAVSNHKGEIVLSWALLKTDHKAISFNVYRIEGNSRDQSGFRVNVEPVRTTSFKDTNKLILGGKYQYRVLPVQANGHEGNPSEWVGIAVSKESYPVVIKFKPLCEKGGLSPVFGDLEGWGKKGCVIRMSNGNDETSQDPGVPVQLEAFSSTGRSLWRKNIAYHENIYGSANNAPFNVWDMNGEGRDEVITLIQIGETNYLAILDGMSGKILYQTPWPKMATDLSKSSTRIQMSIAYLDGKKPSVIIQTGIYENEIITAYDNKLDKLWEYKSFMETSGSGGHKIEVADVNSDGKQEIIYGTTCLNSDGTMRWSIYRTHPDIISIHDYLPDRPGLEVFFIVETALNAGVYMVDANTGEVIWKNNRDDDPSWSHGHSGWTADIWDGTDGIECVTNRRGHADQYYLLFSADGKKIMENFPIGFIPIEWDGDSTRELLNNNGKTIGNFNGREIEIVQGEMPNPIPNTGLIFAADLFGDFRTDLVLAGTDTDGRPMVMVVTADEVNKEMFIAPSQDTDYRLWLSRNIGGGYGSVYDTVYRKLSD